MASQIHHPTQAKLISSIVRDPLVVDAQTTLQDAIAEMNRVRNQRVTDHPSPSSQKVHQEIRAGCVVVVTNGTVVGIVTEHDLVPLFAQGQSLDTLVVGDVIPSPIVALHETDLDDLCSGVDLFQHHNVSHIAILGQEDALLGIITQTSLWQSLNPLELYASYRILEQNVARLEAEQEKQQEDFNSTLAQRLEEHTTDLRLRAEQERLMAQIAANIAASLHLPEILETAVQKLRDFLNCDRVLIWQFQPDWNGVVVAESVGIGWRASLNNTLYDPCFLGDVAQRYSDGRMIAIDNIYTAGYPDCYLQLLEAYQVKANLVVPIVVSGTLWGLLIAHQCAEYRAWLPSDLTLLNRIAVKMAISIQQATAYQQAQTELTERQRVEAALRQSEETLKLFIQYAPVGIAMLDVNLCYVYASQRWIDDYQLNSLESLEGRAHYDIFPDIPERWRPIHQRCLAGAIERYEEDLFERADGSQRWVRWEVRPWYTSRQQVGGIIIFSEDITARKQTEAHLQESEERLRLALSASNLGLYDLNLKTGAAIINPEYAMMLGYDPSSFQETNAQWIERLHPEDQENVANIYRAYIAGDLAEYKIEFRQRTKHGDWKWIQSVGKLVAWDEAGQPLRMLGTHSDISDRKQAEAERLQTAQMRHELKLLEKILDVVLAGYWDWDIPHHHEYLSPSFKQMFGYEDHELPNSPETWQQLIFPEDLPGVLDCFNQHVHSHGEVPYYNEVRYRHRDGSTVWVICSGQVIEWDPVGNPLRMIGCHVDITKRKQAELHLQQRTAQLQASNQELEAFAYSVSHDLRAPLRAIDGFSTAIIKTYRHQLGENGKDYLDRIRNNVNRMGLLIDDLLRLSRVSRSEMKYEPVNLSALVQDQINELKTVKPERQVEVIIQSDIVVLADATLMRIVINNLIQNAWKFTSHHPSARIEFGIVSTTHPPTYFVRDDGAGFDMAYANMLFGVFQRLHDTHEFPGTGIGLATVQRAIHRHGGMVWAEAIVEQGATIYFSLPHVPLNLGA